MKVKQLKVNKILRRRKREKLSPHRCGSKRRGKLFVKGKFRYYVYSALATLAVGGLSALLTFGNMDIYDTVKTPPLSPPSLLFPIAWTVLYLLMSVSFTRVLLRQRHSPRLCRNTVSLYALNLVFNLLWSPIFFNCRAFLFSFVWLVLLWFIIFVMTVNFYRTDKIAGLLLIPYLLWVTFAGYLNLGIYILNR